jgi:hypothetical protein
VAGAIAIVVVLVVVIPVLVLMSGSIAAAILGTFMVKDGEERNEGSELLDLNV